MSHYRGTTVVVAFMAWGAVLHAQPAAEHLSRADIAYTARRADEALEHLLRAITVDPGNYEAQWKASRSEVDLAEATTAHSTVRLLEAAQLHAQAAVRLRPAGAEGHFALARALGRRALGLGVRERIRLAEAIRAEALAALDSNPRHAGALHVLGMWHAELMRVNGMSRRFAKMFLGADLFDSASWDEAQDLLEAADRLDPGRVIHWLDLAGIYADRGDKARARELYVRIASAPLVDPNDDLYKRQAAERFAASSLNP
jgi:tetratricopeptide (TPR) repeat protein